MTPMLNVEFSNEEFRMKNKPAGPVILNEEMASALSEESRSNEMQNGDLHES
jgi:hypothetical protein